MKTKILKAFNGDSLHISYVFESKTHNIIIDGGAGKTYFEKNKKGKRKYNDLYNCIEEIKAKGQFIDLLVLTHVDEDHIGGILKWLKYDDEGLDLVKKVWFNSGRTIQRFLNDENSQTKDFSLDFYELVNTDTSIRQGSKFEDFLNKKVGLWDENIIMSGSKLILPGIKCEILSPNYYHLKDLLYKWESEDPASINTSFISNDYSKSLTELINEDLSFEEDFSVHNGSSIAFILEKEDKNLLFLGDAFPSVICESILSLGHSETNRLECEFVKLSHHGSKHNTNYDFLNLINCNKFIISTDGSRHNLPNKKTIARIAKIFPDSEILFNYSEIINDMFFDEDFLDFPNLKLRYIEKTLEI